MKKLIAFLSGILFALGFIFLLAGVVVLFSSLSDGILILILDIFVFYIGIKLNRCKISQPVLNSNSNSILSKEAQQKYTSNTVPDGMMNYNLFEDIYNKGILSYEYEENLCLSGDSINDIIGNGGKSIEFMQEPENPFDPKAVAIYLNNVKLGYVYRGKTQDMVNDWIKRDDPFLGYINKYSITEGKATYKIAFYKPLEKFVNKSYALVKTSKKVDEVTKRSDNLFSCNDEDSLIIEYDHYEDCYIVRNDYGEEIGELPKSATKFIEQHQYQKIVGVLHEEADDYGELAYKVTIYLI